MKVEKSNDGGTYLKVKDVQEKKITKLKIIDEGELVTFKPKKEGEPEVTKLALGIEYEGQKEDDPRIWTLNNRSKNALIDVFDDDTAKWVGKVVEINITGDNDYKYIAVDTLRTK